MLQMLIRAEVMVISSKKLLTVEHNAYKCMYVESLSVTQHCTLLIYMRSINWILNNAMIWNLDIPYVTKVIVLENISMHSD